MNQQNPQSKPHPAGPAGGTTARLLVIDDAVDEMEPLKKHLESTGRYEVHTSDSPLLGVELAKQLRPDVIVLDIVMPMYDGGDVQAMLRRLPALRHTPVIVRSSLVGPEETNEEGYVISAGDVMVSKPTDFDKLTDLVDRMVRGENPAENANAISRAYVAAPEAGR